MKNRNIYFFFIAVALLVGGISALISGSSMDLYAEINRPALSPPGILFPIVWTVLYILMGVSAARIYIANEKQWDTSLTVWAVQLAVNFFWSIIFFNLRAFLFAFIWLILLWVLIIAMIILFNKRDKIAAYLQIPYLIWVTFAGYLTFSIYLLN